MRKIIQIQIDSQPSCRDWNGFQELFALCDDGTVWVKRTASLEIQDWSKLPDVPQDKND